MVVKKAVAACRIIFSSVIHEIYAGIGLWAERVIFYYVVQRTEFHKTAKRSTLEDVPAVGQQF
jgi:hypothetical protein